MDIPINERKANTFDFKKLRELDDSKQIAFIKMGLDPNIIDIKKDDLCGLSDDVKEFILNEYIERNPMYLAQCIDEFELKNDEQKYNVATKLIENNLEACFYIDNFNIENEAVRIKIANDLLNKNLDVAVLSCLDKFEITNKEFLDDLAEKSCETNSEVFVRCFDKFNIEEEDKRIYYARKVLKHNSSDFALFLPNFQIENRDALLEFAKTILEESAFDVFSNIHNFKIDDDEILKDFAKQIVNTQGSVIGEFITEINLNEKERIAFAKEIAKSYDGEISKNIHRFRISDEKERIKIAKMALSVNADKMLEYIQKYDIKDHETLLDIAKKGALISSGVSIMDNIDYFNIDNIADLNYIFSMVIAHPSLTVNMFSMVIAHPSLTVNMFREIQKYNEQLEKNFPQLKSMVNMPTWRQNIINLFIKDKEKDVLLYSESLKNIGLLLQYYKDKMSGKIEVNFDVKGILGEENANRIEKLLKGIREKRIRDYEVATDILEKILFASQNNDKTKEFKDEMTEIIVELIEVKNFNLKNKLLPYVIKFINDDNLSKIRQELELDNENKKSYPAINTVIFENLCLYNSENKELLEKVRKLFKSNRFTKDSKSVQEVLKSLLDLSATYLEKDKIVSIITNLMENPSQFKKNMKYITSTVYLDKIDKLEEYSGSDFKALFYDIYRNLGLIDESFINSYESFINKKENENRNLEQYIMRYVACNHRYKDVMKNTKEFIKTLGNEDMFKNKRYSIENSKHLETIKNINEDLYNKWTRGQQEFQSMSSNNSVMITDDAVDLFLIGTEVDNSCQSVMYDGEYNKCLMGYVMDGKNKAVVIKDKNGRIVARSIIKLFLNSDLNKVVMLKERMYKKTGYSNDLDFDLKNKCIEYAKWLGVDLVIGNRVDVENGKSKGKNITELVVKQGPAQYEYEDAMAREFQGGQYAIYIDLKYLHKITKG